MIEVLQAHNFQCHREESWELGPITTLIGRNDAGKSAVLRLLKWLALGEWDGKAGDYVTWGEEECWGTIEVDGKTISRKRIKDKNFYEINGDEKKAFGASPPGEVFEILKLTRDNFQDQDDLAYWLTLNSGDAAKALNEIFNLTEIDDAVALISAELRDARKDVTDSEARLQEADAIVQQYAWVEQTEKDLAQAEKISSDIKRLETEINATKLLLVEMEKAERIEKYAAEIVQHGEAAVKLTLELVAVDTQIRVLREIIDLEERQCLLQTQIKEKEKRLAEVLKVCPLCQRSEASSPPTGNSPKSRQRRGA